MLTKKHIFIATLISIILIKILSVLLRKKSPSLNNNDKPKTTDPLNPTPNKPKSNATKNLYEWKILNFPTDNQTTPGKIVGFNGGMWLPCLFKQPDGKISPGGIGAGEKFYSIDTLAKSMDIDAKNKNNVLLYLTLNEGVSLSFKPIVNSQRIMYENMNICMTSTTDNQGNMFGAEQQNNKCVGYPSVYGAPGNGIYIPIYATRS